MDSLIYTANTVVVVLTILLAIVGSALRPVTKGLFGMSVIASLSIWGTVLLRLGAPVWPYIAYALLLLIFYFEVYLLMGIVGMIRRKV